MQVFTGLPISRGPAAGKIIFLGTQEAVVRQAGSPGGAGALRSRTAAGHRRARRALEKAEAELGEKDAEIFSVHQHG